LHLSLVIPAYNEAERIAATLEKAGDYLSRQPYSWEVVVVDDGSADDTAATARAALPAAQILSYRPNRGKGHAVKTGMLAAQGDYRVFYDADASTPIEELEKLWPHFEDGADVVIGSRSLPESRVEVRQAWYRQTMGRAFNLLLRITGLTHFPDTQCGFKGFTAAACEVVFPLQTVERYSFDAEVLYIARRHRLRIDQVPVRWINCPHTRLNAATDSARMLLDLLAIRVRALFGRYA
jgi:dolichyl-phosphate beta-glucosyltransferase